MYIVSSSNEIIYDLKTQNLNVHIRELLNKIKILYLGRDDCLESWNRSVYLYLKLNNLLIKILNWPYDSYAAFTHAGLTTRYRTKNLIKVLLCCQGHAIFCLWRW